MHQYTPHGKASYEDASGGPGVSAVIRLTSGAGLVAWIPRVLTTSTALTPVPVITFFFLYSHISYPFPNETDALADDLPQNP